MPGRGFSIGVRGSFISPPTPKSARRTVPSPSTSTFPALTSRCAISNVLCRSVANVTHMDETPRMKVDQAFQDLLDYRLDLLFIQNPFCSVDIFILLLSQSEPRGMVVFRCAGQSRSPVEYSGERSTRDERRDECDTTMIRGQRESCQNTKYKPFDLGIRRTVIRWGVCTC